jgi:hypothetical protein
MSRLYSSPELIRFEVFSLEVSNLEVSSLEAFSLGLPFSCRFADEARVTRTESQCRSIPERFCRASRSTKTRSPTVQPASLAAPNHLACQNKHRFLA